MAIQVRQRQVRPQVTGGGGGGGGGGVAAPIAPVRSVAGQGFEALSRAASEFLVRAKEKRERTEQNNAYAKGVAQAGDLERQAIQARGMSAEGTTASSLQVWDKSLEDLTKGMSEDSLAAFRARMAPVRARLGSALSRHESSETDAAEDASFQAAASADVQALTGMRGTPQGFDFQAVEDVFSDLDTTVTARMAAQGQDVEVAREAGRAAKAQGIAGMVSGMTIEGDVATARAVFDRYKGMLDAKTRGELTKALRAQEAHNRSVDVGDALLERYGGEGQMGAGLRALREMDLPSEVGDAARKRYEAHFRLNRAAQVDQEGAFLDGVLENIGKAGYNLPMAALERTFGTEKAREIQGRHERMMLYGQPDPQAFSLLAKYDMNRENPDFWEGMSEDEARWYAYQIGEAGKAEGRSTVASEFQRTYGNWTYGPNSPEARKARAREKLKPIVTVDQYRKDTELAVFGPVKEQGEDEIRAAGQFRMRLQALQQAHPGEDPYRIVDMARNEILMEDDWINSDLKAHDVKPDEVRNLYVPKEQWTGREVFEYPRVLQEIAREGGKRLDEDDVMELLGLRRAMSAATVTDEVRLEAFEFFRAKLGLQQLSDAELNGILQRLGVTARVQ